MIRYTSDRQLTLEGFSLPFGGKLNPENRWIKWQKVIPWDEFAIRYYRTLDPHQGRPAKDARLVNGVQTIALRFFLERKRWLRHLRSVKGRMGQNIRAIFKT
ncbi:MAG: hypothetical protein WGN25_19815 [Candidatus Electrothrix sp. GW3-4]|uniref:hypothetical protein n=1 Tax=Candidatus Electrothrix sp. GW3-4 TaxID=3126740 RepID=UPI0030CC68D8